MSDTEEVVDERVRVAANKVINLSQLDQEAGGHGLTGSYGDVSCFDEQAVMAEVVAVEGSPVTEAQLASAVEAHVAVWPDPEPTVADLMAEIAALRAQLGNS